MSECLSFVKFRNIRKTYLTETRSECRKVWNKYIESKHRMNSSTCTGEIYAGSIYTSGWVSPTTTTSYGDACNPNIPTYSFDTPEMCPSQKSFWAKQKEGNNPMNYATATVTAATTETQDQRKYLTRRLDDIYYALERPLFATFGLTDDPAPTTPKELKARIADGKFTIIGTKDGDEDEDEDDFWYGGWSRMIRWRDPAKKADQDGYDAARKDLKAEYQKALDTIKIDDVKAGLDAIKALEAWEPSKTA